MHVVFTFGFHFKERPVVPLLLRQGPAGETGPVRSHSETEAEWRRRHRVVEPVSYTGRGVGMRPN
jgi:hypothetical protein